jgi:CheY-like chemotaxis protein
MEAAPRPRILCVDDDPAIRDVVEILLRKEGYIVETASDGSQAWQRLSTGGDPVDLLVTDNEMPELSGLGLVARIRSAGIGVKVVMFSGFLNQLHEERARELPVDALVRKGSGPVVLLEAIHRLLNPGGAERGSKPKSDG